jgi:hypothetical protein
MNRSKWLAVSLCLFCACAVTAVIVGPAFAVVSPPLSSTPDKQVWVTNGTVNVIAPGSGGITFVGGDFTYVGPNTGNGAALNTTSGVPDMTFPTVEGNILATVADGAGGFYIGGDFTKVGGLTRDRIAHILAGGSVDPAFDPNANNTVRALAVSGSTVYAGGDFTSIGGQTRNHIAALAASGSATAWDPSASNTTSDVTVRALAVSGTTVYVGGNFTSIGGQSRSRIAALDAASGSATAWDPNAGGSVSAVAVSGATVYAGGNFTSIGGQTRLRIAALDATSGAATEWAPDASNWVSALAVSGSTVYAGGIFNNIGGQPRNHIAALDVISGLATPWDPGASDYVCSLAVSGSTVYAGGNFTSVGGRARAHIAALDATGAATSWQPDTTGEVDALAVSGSTIYAGGQFASAGGVRRNHIAALDASGAATAWDPNADNAAHDATVRALAVSGSNVYVGGNFTSIGGQDRHCIAALDADGGTATAWNPNADGYVRALAVSGSTVYAGGDFTSIGGQSRSCIAALDVTSSLATTWDPGVSYPSHPLFQDPYVSTLAVEGATVYAGGRFTYVGNRQRFCLAAIGTNGAVTSWDTNAPCSSVSEIAVAGPTLFVGGVFSNILGSNIGAVNLATATPEAWNPHPHQVHNSQVKTLAVSGSTVYVGGEFDTVNGLIDNNVAELTRNSIAAVSSTTGMATMWDPNLGGGSGGDTFPNDIAVSGSSLFAGGNFTTVGGQSRPYLARFSPITTPWIGTLKPARGRVGTTLTITGANFGATRGTAKVSFGSRVATGYVSWSRTTIKVRVPKLRRGAKSITIKTSAGKSNAESFKVI